MYACTPYSTNNIDRSLSVVTKIQNKNKNKDKGNADRVGALIRDLDSSFKLGWSSRCPLSPTLQNDPTSSQYREPR